MQEEAEKQKRLKAQSEEEKKELERLRAQTEEERRERERLLAQTEEERREREKEREILLAQTEEERRERERLLAQTEEERQEKEKEIERLRTETEKATATKEELAKAMQKAEAKLQQLEEEKQKLKEEKLVLEEQMLKAEKDIAEMEQRIIETHERIDSIERGVLEEASAQTGEEQLDAPAGEEQLDVTGGTELPEVDVEVKVEFDEDDASTFGPTVLERDAMQDDDYWFNVPATFSESKRNKPSQHELDKMMSIVPDFVGQAIMSAMPPETVITGIPQLVYWYNQRDRLPNWTVIWFMRALRTINNRCSDEALFFKAIHLIEAWRERNMYG